MANEYKTVQQLDTKSATYTTDSQDMLLFTQVAILLNVENVDGTTPTLNITIQHSMNDADWETLHAFTEVTAAGKQFKYIPDSSDDGFMRYLRAVVTIGGSSPVFTFELTMIGKD